jgi:hypothetical protein
VTDHDRVELVLEIAVRDPFTGFEFLACTGNRREFVMGIDACGTVAGEVFAAGEDSLFSHGDGECPGELSDLFGGFAEGPVFQRVVSFVVKGDIENGAEIEIESKESEEFAGEFTMALKEGFVTLVSELFDARGFGADLLQTGDTTPFLIDRDDRFELAKRAEVVDEISKLLGGFDIASEENKSSGLDFTNEGAGRLVDGCARDTDHQKFTSMTFHRVVGRLKAGRFGVTKQKIDRKGIHNMDEKTDTRD